MTPAEERRRQTFTVDVELDQLLTAFNLPFLNLRSTLLIRDLADPSSSTRSSGGS